MKYRKEIDGLRAIAVVPVIWFHSGFLGLPGGYLGVDVFFVISGFLITTILMQELGSGTFSFANFYERRARRILPALFLMLGATIPLAWVLLDPETYADYSKSLASVVVFASNIHFWETAGYFGLDAVQQPLLHTWSLAVEEQFYIVLPLLLVVVHKWKVARQLLFFAVLACLSLMISEWGWRNKPEVNFFFTFSRFWELIAGSLAAIIVLKFRPKGWGVLAGIGLLSILGAMVLFDETTPVPSLYTVIPVAGSVLVLIFAQSGTLVAGFLSLRMMVGIGLMSYSAYLWHHPLFAFARLANPSYPEDPHYLVMAALIVATFVLAALSLRYVEAPFRKSGTQGILKRPTLVLLFTSTGAAFLVFGLIGNQKDGFPRRYYSPSQLAFLETHGVVHRPKYVTRDCILQAGDSGSLAECFETPRRVLLWGDSHAGALSTGLGQVTSLNVVASGGCLPTLSYVDRNRPKCEKISGQILRIVAEAAPEVIFLHADWYRYNTMELSGLDETLNQLKMAATHADIYVVGGTPQWFPSLPERLLDTEGTLGPDHMLLPFSIEAISDRDTFIKRIAEKHDIQFLSLLDKLCDERGCRGTVPDPELGFRPLMYDGAHLSEHGSRFVAAQVLWPMIE